MKVPNFFTFLYVIKNIIAQRYEKFFNLQNILGIILKKNYSFIEFSQYMLQNYTLLILIIFGFGLSMKTSLTKLGHICLSIYAPIHTL